MNVSLSCQKRNANVQLIFKSQSRWKKRQRIFRWRKSLDALVDYDSEDNVIKVIEIERDSEETIRKDREEKKKKEETEGRGNTNTQRDTEN